MPEVCAAPVVFEDDGPCMAMEFWLSESEPCGELRDSPIHGNADFLHDSMHPYQPPVKAVCRLSAQAHVPLDDGTLPLGHEIVPGTICPTCGGRGRVQDYKFGMGFGGDVPCPTCHGLRVVPLEVTSA